MFSISKGNAGVSGKGACTMIANGDANKAMIATVIDRYRVRDRRDCTRERGRRDRPRRLVTSGGLRSANWLSISLRKACVDTSMQRYI